MSTSYTVTGTPTYNDVFNTLCARIIANTDTTILNEAEGLDLYIDINMNDASTDTTDVADTNVFNLIYAFKKKSSPTC